MISEIIIDRNLNQDFSSQWFQMKLQNLEKTGEYLVAETINLLWKDVRFMINDPPTIQIECSENGINPFFIKELAIENIDNSLDSTSIVVTQIFNYIRFKIIANSCSEGKIDIFINYR